MVATLPGRTVGLGLITEQLLVDLGVTRSSYAELNLWATSLLFVAAIPSVDSLLGQLGWRKVWMILAAVIFGISLLVAFLIRDPQAQNSHGEDDETTIGTPFREALRSPAFWVLTVGVGIYYFAFTGITLFSESLVVSLDFSRDIRNWFLAIMMFSGLASNLCCGWLVQRVSVLNIFGGAMIIFAACLIGFPVASGSIGLIYAVAVALGVGSGAVTVIFFAGFADLFGKRHLGKIQGVAQAMTVASSGTGPLFFARSFESSGSYSLVFFTLAPLALLVGIWALCHQRTDAFAGR